MLLGRLFHSRHLGNMTSVNLILPDVTLIADVHVNLECFVKALGQLRGSYEVK